MSQGTSSLPTTRVLEIERPEDEAMRRNRWTAWVLTWVSYAMYYLARKGLSVTKAPIAESLGKDVLTGVETAYLAAYALGQHVNGFLGDRVGARRLVGFGMLLSAGACFAFGLSSVGIGFALAYTINGYAQSTGWPGNVKAMSEWTTPQNRGRVMGVWATCYQVGEVVATSFATFLLGYSWRASFLVPAVVVAIVGVLVLLLLKPGPGAATLPVGPAGAAASPIEAAKREEAALAESAERRAERARVLKSPTIWCYGASYFGMKLIRYSLVFWLPFYLHTALHYTDKQAGYMSLSFGLGGVVGTMSIGAISNRYRELSRSVLSAIWLVLLGGALFMYARLGATGTVTNFLVMALVGALLYGPDTLITGAATQDAGGKYAAATAAGIVNGIGSIGAVLQELVTKGVTKAYGWEKLFYVFVALAVFSAACLVPTFRTRGNEQVSRS